MLQQPNVIRYGANFKIVGKTDPQNLSYAGAWEVVEGAVADLAEHVIKGHPWMPALLDGNRKRWQTNSNLAYVLGIDVDGGMTLEEARNHPFIRQYAALIIESASSTPEHNKFRIVFVLPYSVQGWQTIRNCNIYLAEQIGYADPACKDASRYFFGAPGRSPFLLNESATLPESFVDDALAWDAARQAEYQRLAELERKRWEEFRAANPDTDPNELILQALDYADPDESYSDWIGIGATLQALGFPVHVWDGWSAKGSKYQPGACDRKWKSFRNPEPRLGHLFNLAKRGGFQFPKREYEAFAQVSEPDPTLYDSYRQWEDEQERIDQAQADESTLQRILSTFRRGTRKLSRKDAPSGFASAKSEPAAVVEYEAGDRLSTWNQAINAGFKYVLDTSGTGGGKSYDTGLIEPELWGFERAWYISPEHRNPSTATLASWADLEARHSGLTGDERGKVRRVTNADQEIAVQSNCSRAGAIAILRAKNVEGADADTACNTCPMLNGCKHFSGNGYGFKNQRRNALLNERIRSHPDSLPMPDEWDYSREFGIVDEAGETLATDKKLNVQIDDLTELRLALVEAGLYQQYKPVLDTLQALLTQPAGRWGRPHHEIVDTLRALLPNEVDFNAIAQATAPDLSALTPPDEVDLSDFYQERDRELDALKVKYDKGVAELKRHKELTIVERSQNLFEGQTLKQIRSAVHQEFKDKRKALRARYDSDVKALKAKYHREYKELNREVIKLTAQHSAQAADILKATVLKQWFSDFLSAVLYGDRVLHIRWGELTITMPDLRMRQIAQQMGAFIALDATLTREDLALKLGCSPDEIFVCQQRQEATPNLDVIQVDDMGRLGMNRGKDQERRVAACVEYFRMVDSTAQVIDFKKFDADGAWWRDSRGVNDFLDCKTLVLAGTPCRNINDLFAEYSLLTGCKSLEDGEFKAYVDRRIRADFLQAVGRLRANRRQDERLRVIILSDFDIGILTTVVKGVDVCPEAGSKVDQFVIACKGAIARLQEAGEKLTQSAIAAIAGYSQQYVSRHWNLLQTLLDTSNSKSGKNPAPDEVVELVESIALKNSPEMIVECLESGLYDFIKPKYWPDICRRISNSARVALLDALAGSLPVEMLQEAVA